MSLAFVAPNINRGGGKRDLAARLSSGVALLALFPFGDLRFKCHAHGSAWFCVHILSEVQKPNLYWIAFKQGSVDVTDLCLQDFHCDNWCPNTL